MQIKLRHLKGEDITSLQPKELMTIEEALENGLASVRDKQSEIVNMLRKNGKMLEEENKHLNYKLRWQQEMGMDGNVRDLENGYDHQRSVRDQFQPQMPFAFRVQPIQPNLQERI
uniref:Putative MADS-domain transcription factor n=1 Tax=Davidia involucrata TaxID=16924 RepID=A0A5B6Z0U9_DAVIN